MGYVTHTTFKQGTSTKISFQRVISNPSYFESQTKVEQHITYHIMSLMRDWYLITIKCIRLFYEEVANFILCVLILRYKSNWP